METAGIEFDIEMYFLKKHDETSKKDIHFSI